MLDDDELYQLQEACAGFGEAFRIAYPKRGGLLTPKGYIVEKHVHYFATKYGTLGVFGEDGMESLRPLEARARVLRKDYEKLYEAASSKDRTPDTDAVVQPHRQKNEIRIIEFSSRQVQKNRFSLVQCDHLDV